MRAPSFWRRDGTAARLLSPLGCLYHAAGSLRRRLVTPVRAGIPVICVGNISSGGAGKTPVVLSLLQGLRGAGIDAQALTRGYGGSLAGPLRVEPGRHSASEVGDEALLLAEAAPTWVARNRAAGAKAAKAAGAETVVMDDGFQNPVLLKDLSLVVVDGAVGLGNGRVLPAGPLRERPESGWRRADAVVFVGADATGLTARLPEGLPHLAARLAPEPEAAARLTGRRVLAFAGIGRPEKFFETLDALGAEIMEMRPFADHHPFTAEEIARLAQEAAGLDALLVTTQKDRMRLPDDLPPEVTAGIASLPVALTWENPAALGRLLEPLLGPRAVAAFGTEQI